MHRLNGKVSGSLRVGRASVRFQDVDLHAYIVGSDGRAYTAISGVPQPAARALLPLLPVGGLFAWLFALEEPGSENGFSITGETGFGMWQLWGFVNLSLTSLWDPSWVCWSGREGRFGVVPTNDARSLFLPRR